MSNEKMDEPHSLKVGICQPLYLPWLGFFEQVDKADVFVLYDDVEYSKRSWYKRNRINYLGQERLISLQLKSAPDNILLNQQLLSEAKKVLSKHLNLINISYRHHPMFATLFPQLEAVYEKAWQMESPRLLDLTIPLVKLFSRLLQYNARFMLSSDLGVPDSGRQQRVIDVCRKVGASYLFNGRASESFMDVQEFKRQGVVIEFQHFKNRVYPSHHQFIPQLSVLDLLMNITGDEAAEVIRQSNG